MASDISNPARGEAAGLGISSSFSGADNPKHSSSPAKKQQPSDVDRTRASLLRDLVIEALTISAHYSETSITFAQLGDDECLELSMREFAKTASIATKTARELIDLRRKDGAG